MSRRTQDHVASRAQAAAMGGTRWRQSKKKCTRHPNDGAGAKGESRAIMMRENKHTQRSVDSTSAFCAETMSDSTRSKTWKSTNVRGQCHEETWRME